MNDHRNSNFGGNYILRVLQNGRLIHFSVSSYHLLTGDSVGQLRALGGRLADERQTGDGGARCMCELQATIYTRGF